MPALTTHADWHAEFVRLLDLSATRPAQAATGLVRLAKAVERAMPKGVNDWHLAQTWQHLSLAQARSGDHVRAAATLRELAAHHDVMVSEHRRAHVAATAAAAVHLAKAGDRAGSKALLRQAEALGKGLRPQDEILKMARHLLAARPAPAAKRTRVTPTA